MDKEFEEIYDVLDYEIMTDTGWKDIKKVCKTIPYDVWNMELEDGKNLKCADNHIVFSEGKEVFIKDICIDDYIDTENGKSKCKTIYNTNIKENMYDIQVDGKKYFSNGILSHNTTVAMVYVLWYAIFNSDKNIGIVSNKEKSAKSILRRFKNMYKELPAFLKPGVVRFAETSVEFDNGTVVTISATSEDAFRGEPMNILIMDEFAFVPKGQANAFWAANYPTISASKESKIIIISTPNGMFNLFHQIYSKAENGLNTFKHMKVSWERVPGRDEKWKEKQIKNMGRVRFDQEFAVKFLGSTNTVIDPEVLESLITFIKDPIHKELDEKFLIYEKPIEGCSYVMGVDTAKGTGEHYSAIQVLKIESLKPIKLKQVAVFYDNNTDVYKFAEIINRISYYFNRAWMMIESNAEGAAIVNLIWYEYENDKLVNSGSKVQDLGIRASTKTKPRAVLLMKKLIEDGSLLLYDRETIDELSSFIEVNGKFFGKDMPDDLISGLYWASYIIEMNILDEKFQFKKEAVADDAWGIIPEVEYVEEDWSWLNYN